MSGSFPGALSLPEHRWRVCSDRPGSQHGVRSQGLGSVFVILLLTRQLASQKSPYLNSTASHADSKSHFRSVVKRDVCQVVCIYSSAFQMGRVCRVLVNYYRALLFCCFVAWKKVLSKVAKPWKVLWTFRKHFILLIDFDSSIFFNSSEI